MKKGMLQIPRVVVAAPHGRSGKTTVTLGLLAALKRKGYNVQPFKKGLDFIDPSWMTMVTGNACRNLDSFLMDREIIRRSFIRHGIKSDIAVVEGAMGLFDGVDIDGSGSTGEIARAIEAPVILVVDTTRMTRSVAPLVQGFMHFDPGVKIAGVILNKVARSRHESMLRQAVDKYCGIPVLGVIPKGGQFTIPDRHLGLIPAAERDELACTVDEIGGAAQSCLDLEGILAVARSAPPLEAAEEALTGASVSAASGARPVIGVFRDRAFTFYYPENLEALARAGAELLFIDAMNHGSLPAVDAVYIGGGFPEVFAEQLEANSSLRHDLQEKAEKGLPIYAECGGLMYLARSLTWEGRTFSMSGVLPLDVVMTDKPQGHGYEVVEVVGDNPFFETGTIVKGHEFHNSRVINIDEEKLDFVYKVNRGSGIGGHRDGAARKNVLAAYNHLHALNTPGWAPAMVARAREYKAGK